MKISCAPYCVELLGQKNKLEQRMIVLGHDQPHAVLRSNVHAARYCGSIGALAVI